MKNVITLAPRSIFIRAKKLSEKGEHEKALELLEKNIIEFEISNNIIAARISSKANAPQRRRPNGGYLREEEFWSR